VKCLPPRWFFRGPNREVSKGQVHAVRHCVQEVPTVVPEFSPGLLGLWHCHDEAVALDIFCELHLEISTELHSSMQNSHFHHASENGLTVHLGNPQNTVSVTLNFLVEGELGCFHCIEACFDSGWQ
jgi:hypothetical protein